MKRRPLLTVLWIGGGLLAIFFVVRIFFADLYRVDSGSMEPTIHGGDSWDEWVLVRYSGTDDLERFDLAVAYSDVGEFVVKRVIGLPGENIQILGGDLFIDGKRLSANAPRPGVVPLFDSEHQSVEAEFRMEPSNWTESPAGWVLDTRDKPEDYELSTLHWQVGLDDGYLLPDGTRVQGSRAVNDGGLELDVEFLEASGTLRIDLREEGDCFRASLVLTGEGSDAGEVELTVRLERLRIIANTKDVFGASVLAEPETLVEQALTIHANSIHRLHFSNIDNTLFLSLGDKLALSHTYSDNRLPKGVSVAPGKTIGAQAAVGGEDLLARISRLRVVRDFNWISRGEFGVERPISLGPGEYFLLGDNSSQSLDGRTWGATRKSDILGRPLKVIWPRERARSLDEEHWRRVSRPGSSN